MVSLWFYPTGNVLINTFLRSLVFIALAVTLGYSWYVAYWTAVIHDAISLILVRQYV
jgi:hypothetical protein